MELPNRSNTVSRTGSSRPIFQFLSHASSSYSNLIPHSLSSQQLSVDENKLLLLFFLGKNFSGTLLIPHRLRNGVLLKYFRVGRTRQLALRQHHRRFFANNTPRKEKVLRSYTVSQRRAASVSGERQVKMKFISFPVPFWAESLPFIISVVCRQKISHFETGFCWRQVLIGRAKKPVDFPSISSDAQNPLNR